jgi:uncharacterized membrane protein YeiB
VATNKLAGRIAALDAARGIAIIMMAYVHMVPSDGPGFAQLITKVLEGKAAVLFFILAGMTWARMSSDKPAAIYRRAGLYCIIGILMHTTIWNTEVLLPLGICLMLFQLLRDKHRIGDLIAALGVVATLMVPLILNGDTAIDVIEQPRELLKQGGFLRAAMLILFTGSYPIVPWWSLVWFGGRVGQRALVNPRILGGVGAVGAVIGFGITRFSGVFPGALRPLTESVWNPTTLPFMLQCGGCALVIIALSCVLARYLSGIANLGRLSLTHYIGHIVIICVPLYARYPTWNWPAEVGLIALGIWVAGAILLSHFWLLRNRRGPVELTVHWLVSR